MTFEEFIESLDNRYTQEDKTRIHNALNEFQSEILEHSELQNLIRENSSFAAESICTQYLNYRRANPSSDFEVYDVKKLEAEFFKKLIICYKKNNAKVAENCFEPKTTKSITYAPKLPEGGYEEFMATFPEVSFWRFFCDFFLQGREKGFHGFEEREPGYLIAMAHGWQTAFADLARPVNIDLIKTIHKSSASSGGDNLKRFGTKIKEGTFRESEISFYFETDDECLGFIESSLLLKGSKNLNGIRQMIFDHEKKAFLCTDRNTNQFNLDKIITNLCENYETEITKQTNDADKLRVIVKFIKTLELIHPFDDANCRTFCMLLLNRELIKHGFFPAILMNPNYFDGFSVETLVQRTVQGMNIAKSISQGQDPELDIINHIDSVFNMVFMNNIKQPIPEKEKNLVQEVYLIANNNYNSTVALHYGNLNQQPQPPNAPSPSLTEDQIKNFINTLKDNFKQKLQPDEKTDTLVISESFSLINTNNQGFLLRYEESEKNVRYLGISNKNLKSYLSVSDGNYTEEAETPTPELQGKIVEAIDAYNRKLSTNNKPM